MSPHNILNRAKSKFANVDNIIIKKDLENNSFFGKFKSLEYPKNMSFQGKTMIDNNSSINRAVVTGFDK